MPFLALALVLLVPLLAILLMPLTLVQRYRAGTARRRARRWLVTVNLALTGLSVVMLVLVAAVTGAWVEGALLAALGGVLMGAVVGVLGVTLSRWEAGPDGLHYTPNRWLVLTLTLLVSARLVYGLWRSWQAWSSTAGEGAWLAAAAVPGSLAAGGIVLGYYLVYWVGVRRRLSRHRRPGTVMTIDHQTGRISYDR